MTDLLLLAGGLATLLLGGYVLVRGASGLASSYGVSPAIVGLTVVAFGTSAPELAVTTMAGWNGQGEMAFGNVVGSNLANLGLILGAAALFRPLIIEGRIAVREIPVMLLATAAVLALALEPGGGAGAARFAWNEGVMLLLVFGVFLYGAVGDVLRGRGEDAMLRQAGDAADAPEPPSRRGLDALLTVLGCAGLYFGGEFTVDGAVGLARAAGMSEVLIGMTVVAVGTSLPELATSLIAAQRGQVDLAIGNVVGSNVFNLLFVLGVASMLTPVPVPAGGIADLVVLLAISCLLLPMALTHRRHLVRWEGAVLLVAWLAHLAVRVATSG